MRTPTSLDNSEEFAARLIQVLAHNGSESIPNDARTLALDWDRAFAEQMEYVHVEF